MRRSNRRRLDGLWMIPSLLCALSWSLLGCDPDLEPLSEYNEVYRGTISVEGKQIPITLSLAVTLSDRAGPEDISQRMFGTLEGESTGIPVVVSGEANHGLDWYDFYEDRELVILRVHPSVGQGDDPRETVYTSSYDSLVDAIGFFPMETDEAYEYEYLIEVERLGDQLEGYISQDSDRFWPMSLGTISLTRTGALPDEIHIDYEKIALEPFIFEAHCDGDQSWSHTIRLE